MLFVLTVCKKTHDHKNKYCDTLSSNVHPLSYSLEKNNYKYMREEEGVVIVRLPQKILKYTERKANWLLPPESP